MFAGHRWPLVLIVVPVLQKECPLLLAQIPALLAQLNDCGAPRAAAQLGIDVKLDCGGLRSLLTQQLAGSGDELARTLLAIGRRSAAAPCSAGWRPWCWCRWCCSTCCSTGTGCWRSSTTRVPRRWVARDGQLAREVDGLLAQYLRGQLLVMLVLAVYYSAALAMAGFEVALPVGILTGLLVFIPYLGFGLGLVLALIAAVLQFAGLDGLIAVAVIYGAGQVIEGFFLTPRLVGERIGLNPLAVIFALLAFGQLFGFVGVLLALPASAMLMVALRHLRALYRDSSFLQPVMKQLVLDLARTSRRASTPSRWARMPNWRT